MGDTPPASSMYLRKSIRENISAQLTFLSLCQTFCDLPDWTSMGELTEMHRLYFTNKRLFVSSFCSTLFVSLASSGETEAYTRVRIWVIIPLQWPGHETTSCKVRWLPLMPLSRHLLWVSRDAGICERLFQSLLLYCHEQHIVLEKRKCLMKTWHSNFN